MFRSGFLLSVSGPVALLTLLIQPTVRQAADQWVPQAPVAVTATPVTRGPSIPRHDASGIASTSISPTRLAAIPSAGPRSSQTVPQAKRTASDKDGMRMRRPILEGCERAISSLAGPEARRMLPGRCMT